MERTLVLCLSVIATTVALPRHATVEYLNEYQYVEGTGSMYKVHKDIISPDQMAIVCTKEGAMPLNSEDPDLSPQLQALFRKEPKLEHVCIWNKGSALKVLRSEEKFATDKCEFLVCKLTEIRNICNEVFPGYSYSPSVGSCYRIPHVTLDWEGAYQYCRDEGTHLAVVNSEAERQELKAKMDREGWTGDSWNPRYYYIGFKADKDRVFRTIFNKTLEEAGYNEWSDTEPNNLHGNENCGSLSAYDGKLNDIICSTKVFAFICEQEIQIVKITMKNTQDSVDHHKGNNDLVSEPCKDSDCKDNSYCKEGYTYSPSGSCYKIPHVTLPWDEAYQYCQNEGTHLAVVNSEAEHRDLKEKMNKDGWTEGSWNPRYYYIGFRADKDRVFKTIFDETLEEAGYNEWSETEPNNLYNDEYCGSLFVYDGKLNDMKCTEHSFAFICEQDLNNIRPQALVKDVEIVTRSPNSTPKGITDFEYVEATKSFYKVHEEDINHDCIVQTCIDEGATVLKNHQDDVYKDLQAMFDNHRSLMSLCIWDSDIEKGVTVLRHGPKIDSKVCSNLVCKKNPDGEDDIIPPPTEAPSEFPSDFEYVDGTEYFYKVHNISLAPHGIVQACKEEEATPLAFTDEEFYKQLQLLFSKYPKLETVCILDSEAHYGILVNSEGERLISEECPTAVCKKPTGCKKGYTFSPSTGSCYKIPLTKSTWHDASQYCRAEDTHLAVVNSATESSTLKTLMARNGMLHGSWNMFYFMGFRADQDKVFRTVFNETLEQAGYSIWSRGPPSKDDDKEYCGSIYTFNGNLNYLPCYTEQSFFICEQEVSHKNLIPPNTIVFPVASADQTVEYYPTDYEYVAGTEHFYKLQKKSLSQYSIVETCKADGGIPLSSSEGDLFQQLRALFGRYKKIDHLCFWHDKYKLPITVNREAEIHTDEDCISLVCKKTTGCKEGYMYSPSTGNCYRIPKEKRMWEEAHTFCEHEGTHLAIINSEAEQKVFMAMVRQYAVAHNTWDMNYYIGFRAGKDRVFKTVLNETLEEAGFSIWSQGEPNNKDGNEYCGSLFTYDGKLNDVPCYKDSSAFICEQDFKRASCRQPIAEVLHGTPLEKYYRKDYNYDQQSNSFYKVHLGKGLPSDRKISEICRSEGASVLTDDREDNLLLDAIRLKNSNLGSVCVRNEKVGLDWLIHIPHQRKQQSMICDTDIHSFVCKVKASEKDYDRGCGKYGAGYKFFKSVSSCYSIPTLTLPWDKALEFCKAQDAHLAVVNSRAENRVLYTMMTKFGWNPNAWNHMYYHIGFRADENRRFTTIFNQSLEETGYNRWSKGEPNNKYGDEYCGSLSLEDGNLNDVKCSDDYGFICEKEADLTAENGATANYDNLVPEDSGENMVTTDSNDGEETTIISEIQNPTEKNIATVTETSNLTTKEGRTPGYPGLLGSPTQAVYLLQPYTLQPGAKSGPDTTKSEKTPPLPINVMIFTLPATASCPCYFLKPNQAKPQIPPVPTPYGIIGYAPVVFVPNCQGSGAFVNEKFPNAALVHYTCNDCQATSKQKRSASFTHEISSFEEMDDLLKKHIRPAREDMEKIGASPNIW